MEKTELENIALNSIYNKGVNAKTIAYSANIFKKYMKPGNVLELGPAEGLMTELLYKNEKEFSKWSNNGIFTCVDGSQVFIDIINTKFPKIDAHCSFFENFKPKLKYQNIILGHVLEHVDDPIQILKLSKEWLAKDGIILTAVPNANSIHRQAAVKMGLLKTVYDFSEKDHRHGHQRVFDMTKLIQIFETSKLKIIKQGGYWLKPLSDKQIEEKWTTKMIEAFFELGEKYPDIAAEIYIISTK